MLLINERSIKTEQDNDNELQMLVDVIKFNSLILGYEVKYDYYQSFRAKDYNWILRWVISDNNFHIDIFFHLRDDMKLMEITTRLTCKNPKIKLDIDEIETQGIKMYNGLNLVKNFLEQIAISA